MTTSTPPTETRLPSRRTVIATSAWAAPAILMTVASPAHAASTDLGVITFAEEPADIVGRGAVVTYAMQLTVPDGLQIPSTVTVAYGTAGVVSGPTTVPTGGKTLFTFEVTALDAETSTEITVSAPRFVPAQTTLTVTTDLTAIKFLHGSSFGVTHKDNVLDQGFDLAPKAPGNIGDYFMNMRWGNPSTSPTNALSLSGIAFAMPGSRVLRGKIDYQLRVLSGGDGLSWERRNGAPNAGRPVAGTVINGTAHRIGGITPAPEYFNTFPAGGSQLAYIVRNEPRISGDKYWRAAVAMP